MRPSTLADTPKNEDYSSFVLQRREAVIDDEL